MTEHDILHHDPAFDIATVLLMRVEAFADFAVEVAIWLVRESMDAITNEIDFDPDPENCFRVPDRLPAIRELEEPTHDQRHDMFVRGFRRIPKGAQASVELLLTKHTTLLCEGFRQRWITVANEIPFT